MFYVYEHWRQDTDTCFYVGKGRGGRAFDVGTRNRYHNHITANLKTLGLDFEIRFFARDLAEEDAFRIERERIAFWRASGVALANLTSGGQGVAGARFFNRKKWSAERLAAVAIKRRGRAAHNKGSTLSLAQRERLSAANRGKPRAPELVEKTAAALRGRKRPEVGAIISAAKAAKKAEREVIRERFPGLHAIVDSWRRKDRAECAARWRQRHPEKHLESLRASRMRRRSNVPAVCAMGLVTI